MSNKQRVRWSTNPWWMLLTIMRSLTFEEDELPKHPRTQLMRIRINELLSNTLILWYSRDTVVFPLRSTEIPTIYVCRIPCVFQNSNFATHIRFCSRWGKATRRRTLSHSLSASMSIIQNFWTWWLEKKWNKQKLLHKNFSLFFFS